MKVADTQGWQQAVREVDRLVDKLGTPMDAGIKDAVVTLKLLGYKTIGSCQGHLDHGTGGPWIHLLIDEAEDLEKRLVRRRKNIPPLEAVLIRRQVKSVANKHLQPLRRLLTEFYATRKVRLDLKISVYNPGGGFVVIESRGVNALLWKNLLEPRYSEKLLTDYQSEMSALTSFLRTKLT